MVKVKRIEKCGKVGCGFRSLGSKGKGGSKFCGHHCGVRSARGVSKEVEKCGKDGCGFRSLRSKGKGASKYCGHHCAKKKVTVVETVVEVEKTVETVVETVKIEKCGKVGCGFSSLRSKGKGASKYCGHHCAKKTL